jgi:hypothetical protein
MSEKYGFIYVWFDKKYKRYYVGSHWGNENDGYVCSSRMMRQSYNRRPDDFKRRIVKRIYTNRKDLLIEEERWLSMIDPNKTTPRNTTAESRTNVRYYNIKLGTQNQWWSDIDSSKTIGEKISASKKGKSAGPCSPEKAAAISKAKKKKFAERGGITEEHKLAIQKAASERNYKHTEEWKQQNSERMKDQWSNGSRKRAEPKQTMSIEEQAKLSSNRLKSMWSDPEWAAKQKLALSNGASKRPPRSEESKQKTRDAFARRRELKLQSI